MPNTKRYTVMSSDLESLYNINPHEPVVYDRYDDLADAERIVAELSTCINTTAWIEEKLRCCANCQDFLGDIQYNCGNPMTSHVDDVTGHRPHHTTAKEVCGFFFHRLPEFRNGRVLT